MVYRTDRKSGLFFYTKTRKGVTQMNMSYETFKEQVNKDIKDYVGEKYPEASTTYKKKYLINEAYDAVKISINNNATSLDIERMYDEYCEREKEDYQDLMSDIYEIIDSALYILENLAEEFNWTKEDVKKDQIVFCLINTEKNKEFLKNLPHREFLDLSVVYKYLPHDGIPLFINNDLCKDMGFNEKELYQLAKENTRKIYDFKCEDYYKFLKKALSKTKIPEEFFELRFGKLKNCNLGYLILAKGNFYGTAGLLYDDILEELSERLKGDFYIIPMSIHECVIHDVASNNAQFLKNLILSQNEEDISIRDFLSDSLYFYSATRKKIEIVE